MTIERYLRLIAGLFVLLSLALGLGKPVLVSLHCICRAESIPVSLHELVPHDDNSSEGWSQALSTVQETSRTGNEDRFADRILFRDSRRSRSHSAALGLQGNVYLGL